MFNPSSTNVFNQFIRDAQLWDIPLGGHLFTRLNKHGNKLSKLDRTNPIVAFKNKMKALKIVIKEWSLNRKDARTRLKEDLISKIKALDADFANGSSSTDGHDQRATCIDNLRQIEHDESIDSSQKAKIKWCMEADDNTKFFHAMV
nr:RNA-directed DNA polymerase, eukaryota, reverse transcriptase zinc-binding domain protein [Tanacetum cinerariifolium]